MKLIIDSNSQNEAFARTVVAWHRRIHAAVS